MVKAIMIFKTTQCKCLALFNTWVFTDCIWAVYKQIQGGNTSMFSLWPQQEPRIRKPPFTESESRFPSVQLPRPSSLTTNSHPQPCFLLSVSFSPSSSLSPSSSISPFLSPSLSLSELLLKYTSFTENLHHSCNGYH